MTRPDIATSLDAFSKVVGRVVAWLTLAMVIVVVAIVILRYVVDVNPIWLQELLTWLHAAVFMLGAAYTLQQDEHVRVDIFYREMDPRRRAWVNAAGTVIFILPLCVFLAWVADDYVQAAWDSQEVSRDSGGLPYPAIPMLKSLLQWMPILIALQGLAILLRSIDAIRTSEEGR